MNYSKQNYDLNVYNQKEISNNSKKNSAKNSKIKEEYLFPDKNDISESKKEEKKEILYKESLIMLNNSKRLNDISIINTIDPFINEMRDYLFNLKVRMDL